MYLYLVQHGEAKPEAEDPQRPLSDKGREDADKVASFISHIKVQNVFHSGKLRAKQTAEIFAEKLGAAVSAIDGLAPMDDPSIWAMRFEGAVPLLPDDNIMLVGHLPHMGRLASLLLCGNSEKGVVEFRMGGVVCLKHETRTHEQRGKGLGLWSIQWMVVPELIR